MTCRCGRPIERGSFLEWRHVDNPGVAHHYARPARAGQDRLGLTAEVVPPVQPEASDLASVVSGPRRGHTSAATVASSGGRSALVPQPPSGAGKPSAHQTARRSRLPVEDTGQ